MKILISNVYSWRNKGDAAIILSMIEHIKMEFPSASIEISSIDKEDESKYDEDSFSESFLSIFKEKYSFENIFLKAFFTSIFRTKLKIFELCTKCNLFPYLIFDKKITNKIKRYKEYDLVIAAGGGYFISKGNKRKILNFLNYDEQVIFAYDFYFASFFNKPYILYNQSIGPFYNLKDSDNLIPFLKKANIVSCREELTMNRLKNLNLKNLIRSEDIAFNLKNTQNDILEKYNFKETDINIGITVRKCLAEKEQKIYELEIKEFIEYCIEHIPLVKFYIMPQVIYQDGGDNDLDISKRIYKQLSSFNKEKVILLREDLHPSDLKYIISEMNYFFGTRFHSCIFALANKVKTIALSYEPKTDGIMQSLKLDNYYIHVDKLTKDKLVALFSEIKEDKNYLNILNTELDRIKKDCYINLKKYMDKK